MNTIVRLLRWLRIDSTPGPRFKSTAPRCGRIRGFLPVLMVGAMAHAAQGQWEFRTEVNLDGTLTVAGVWPFCPTGALTIPDTIDGRQVTSIKWQAFLGCRGLTSVTIPDSVTSIGDRAFLNCPGLTTVAIPDSVTEIGQEAFSLCSGLTSITIPDSVTSIGEMAFLGCTSLTRATIAGSAAGIGNQAFLDCTALTNVTILPNVREIGADTFNGCTNLTSVTIADSVTSIGDSAFYLCTSLTSITIGSGVTSIGGSAFAGCPLEDVLFNKSRTMLVGYPRSWPSPYTIPNGVTHIASSAFSGCTNLISVTIPDSVTSIGGAAFHGCTSLTNVTIGDGVISIGNWAFTGCPLRDVLFNRSRTMLVGYPHSSPGPYMIPNGVTNIASSAFAGCTNLTSVTVPDSVTSIGDSAFYGCTRLTSVTIGNGVASIGSWAFGYCPLREVLFNRSRTMLVGYPHSSPGPYMIPNGVTNIASSAFLGCTNLTSVTIPDSVISIGNHAFWQCSGLTSVTIGNSVARIGDFAFYECAGLTSITIPDSVTSIGRFAFSYCTGLTASYFAGNAPVEVGMEVFQSFAGYVSPTVYYLPGAEGWTLTFASHRTAPWVRPNPTILDFGDRFGPTTNGFGFVISWATNMPVVVEASADISAAGWTPISTNTLTDGWVQFTDPEWKSQPARFYRVRGK